MDALSLQAAQRYLRAVKQDLSLLSSIGDNPFVNQMERSIEQFMTLPPHRAIAVSSATSGMTAVLRALGIGHRDEVILASFGWGQTLNAVLEVGATPVLVDVAEGSANLDLFRVENTITDTTRAILASELFGIPLDWQQLDAISRRTGLLTIIDAAQSFCATHTGPMPTAMVFSFGRGKFVCGGEGGAIVTSSDELYDAVLLSSQHPVRILQNLQASLPFDAVDSVAPNARIHPFAATLIEAQIQQVLKHRYDYHRTIADVRERLTTAGFCPLPVPQDTTQAPPVIPVLTKQPQALKKFCQTHRWQIAKCCQKPLVHLPTTEKCQYLPGLRYLWGAQRRIPLRHTDTHYPNACECAKSLYLVRLLQLVNDSKHPTDHSQGDSQA